LGDMSTEENIRIVRRIFEAFNTGDTSKFPNS
jgi:ketosteroid isomerase-like protein